MKQEQDAAINLIALVLVYLVRGWLLMLAFGVLHHQFPVVPDFSYFESFVLGAAFAFMFHRSKGS